MAIDYIKQLFNYIKIAPPEVQVKYWNGVSRYIKLSNDVLDNDGKPIMRWKKIKQNKILIENPYWELNDTDEAYFNGIMFRDNKVLIFKIYTFDKNKDYEPSYLDITDFFNKMLNNYNIYDLCIIINISIKGFYRDSALTENLIPFIKYDKEYQQPKKRHYLAKHNNKYRKFIICDESENRRLWDQILHKSISKINYIGSIRDK